MADIQSVRKLLAEAYGIKSDQELSEALSKMTKLDIGALTAPVTRKDAKENDKDLCIA